MTTPAQMSAAQRAYEDRVLREWESRCEADDEDNYCSGDCETCKVPYCDISNNQQENNDDGK